jgi:hypothetical protein
MKNPLLVMLMALNYLASAQQIIMVDPENKVPNIPSHINVNTLKEAYDAIQVDGNNKVSQAYTIKLAGNVLLGVSLDWQGIPDEAAPLRWEKSGTSDFHITITSNYLSSLATLNRNIPDSYKNQPFIQVPEDADVNYLDIDHLIFNDAAIALDLFVSHSKIKYCKFFIGDFINIGGGGAINLNGGSHDNEISYNYIKYVDEIVLDRCWMDATIAGNWKCYDLYHGIYLTNCNHSEISHNTIINAPGAGIHAWHGYTQSNTINFNDIYKCNTHRYKLKDTWTQDTTGFIDNSRFGILLGDVTTTETDKMLKHNDISYNNIYSDQTFKSDRRYYYFVNPGAYDKGFNDFALRKDDNRVNTTFGNQFKTWGTNTCISNGPTQYSQRFDINYNSGLGIEILSFIPGELLVLIKDKGTILKLDESQVTGNHNMLALQLQNNLYKNIAGSSSLKGSQVFPNKKIIDVEWADGYTLIAFDDRRILKINGTGGTGENMFKVAETSYGFATIPGYSYYAGSHIFNNGRNLLDIMYVNGFTFVSFSDNSILKVNGSGGSGADLFAIVEVDNNPSYSFQRRGTYPYYAGDAKFSSPVIKMKAVNGVTFFCFENNKVLKINGAGDVDHNMFRVTEVMNNPAVGFTKITNTFHYLGDAIFNSNVSNITYANGFSFFSFKNGKMLKVNGVGGLASNMFAVNEVENNPEIGFTPVGTWGYYVGDVVFKKYLLNNTLFQGYVTDMVYQGGFLLIGFSTGKILKINDVGGTGNNMFGLTEQYHDFGQKGTYQYYAGFQAYHSTVTDITYVNGHSYIALKNGKILRVNETGGTGEDMFFCSENSYDFSQRRINPWWHGDQNLLLASYNPTGRTRTSDEIAEHDHAPAVFEKEFLAVYPNPSENGKFTITSSGDVFTLEILDISGRTVLKDKGFFSEATIDLTVNSKGIYILKATGPNGNQFKRLVYK